MSIGNFFRHLKTVRTHRKWARRYCFKAGLYWQGLTHDLSKYSPIEFFESVKYYQGNRTPIVAAKADKGYSDAWFHHRGRNKHHREYWVDNFDGGTFNVVMPYKYAAEMLCDFIAAARTYMGTNFTYERELDWWRDQLKSNIMLHPVVAKFISSVLRDLVNGNNESEIFSTLPTYYAHAVYWYSKFSKIPSDDNIPPYRLGSRSYAHTLKELEN